MDLKISQMLAMQRELWEKHSEDWEPLTPEYARTSLLYMFEEMGEVVAIIKKKGEQEIMENAHVREELVTEAADVMMYFGDFLLRFGISEEEISEAYVRKHAKNMKRDYAAEYEKLYE